MLNAKRVPDFAPGCFGSALSYNGDMTCRSCKFASACEPVHAVAKLALQEHFGIKPNKAQRPVPTGATAHERARAMLPKKTLELVDKISAEVANVAGELAIGHNPFRAKFKFMGLACHLLLNMPDLDQSTLSTACVRKFGWSQDTANAHARFALQALTHFNAVKNTNGKFSINRG